MAPQALQICLKMNQSWSLPVGSLRLAGKTEEELYLSISVRHKHDVFKLGATMNGCFRKRHSPGDSEVQPR